MYYWAPSGLLSYFPLAVLRLQTAQSHSLLRQAWAWKLIVCSSFSWLRPVHLPCKDLSNISSSYKKTVLFFHEKVLSILFWFFYHNWIILWKCGGVSLCSNLKALTTLQTLLYVEFLQPATSCRLLSLCSFPLQLFLLLFMAVGLLFFFSPEAFGTTTCISFYLWLPPFSIPS